MNTPAPDRELFLKLLEKYNAGAASPEEQTFVEKYYDHLQQGPDVISTMDQQEKSRLKEEIGQRLMNSMQAAEAGGAPVYVLHRPARIRKLAVAAAILLVLVSGTLLYFVNTRPAASVTAKVQAGSTEPATPGSGGKKAILTLADGSTIVLDEAAKGDLSQQGRTRIIKLNEGTLAYNEAAGAIDGNIPVNTIATPRGGEYHVVLPDGTNVWLNADSYLKFPVAFGKERNVEMGGEAYFEVAKDKEKPFRVQVNGTTVQALGTSFNINAYSDEQTQNTTLLEGSVRVTKGTAEKILRPGEQAQVTAGNSMTVVPHANRSEIMAWRNGLFYFNKTDIRTFMRQLERWYDIQVKYEGGIPALNFSGKMQRNLSWSQLLNVLREMGVPYRIEGKVLVVQG